MKPFVYFLNGVWKSVAYTLSTRVATWSLKPGKDLFATPAELIVDAEAAGERGQVSQIK